MGSKSNRGNNDPPGDGDPSSPDFLRAKWKNEIKKRPPAEQFAWLQTPDAITALGLKTVRTILDSLQKRVDRARNQMCSQQLMEAYEFEGIVPHGLDLRDGQLYRKIDAGREHAARVGLSRTRIQYGSSEGEAGDLPLAERGHRRLTPEIALASEERYDLMSVREAAECIDPPSISGLQFQKIRMRRGRERDFQKKDRIVEMAFVGGDEPRVSEVTTAAPFDPNGTRARFKPDG